MPQPLNDQSKPVQRLQFMDALLYLMAAGAMVVISISFLLWLRS